MKFWILWGLDAFVAAVIIFFFFFGLVDGSVSSFNIGLWLIILFILTVILLGGLKLKAMGHPWIGMALLSILAIPAMLYLFFLLMVIFSGPTTWR